MIDEAKSPRKNTTITVATKMSHPSQGLLFIFSCIDAIINGFWFLVSFWFQVLVYGSGFSFLVYGLWFLVSCVVIKEPGSVEPETRNMEPETTLLSSAPSTSAPDFLVPEPGHWESGKGYFPCHAALPDDTPSIAGPAASQCCGKPAGSYIVGFLLTARGSGGSSAEPPAARLP